MHYLVTYLNTWTAVFVAPIILFRARFRHVDVPRKTSVVEAHHTLQYEKGDKS